MRKAHAREYNKELAAEADKKKVQPLRPWTRRDRFMMAEVEVANADDDDVISIVCAKLDRCREDVVAARLTENYALILRRCQEERREAGPDVPLLGACSTSGTSENADGHDPSSPVSLNPNRDWGPMDAFNMAKLEVQYVGRFPN